MSNYRRPPTSTLLPLLLVALTLAGCAGLERPAQEPAGDWNTHRQQLVSLNQWRADGKVALRSAQGADSASLVWQQRGNNTDLLLSGPIGLGATRIHSDGKHLDIHRGGELQRIDISSPDAVARATGWDLPLAALRHWLKGHRHRTWQYRRLIWTQNRDCCYTCVRPAGISTINTTVNSTASGCPRACT